MVTGKTQYSLASAQDYFAEHLSVGDYYDQGQRVTGTWLGEGAQQLGLSGHVRAESFLRLCDNQHPATGEKLTQRLKTTRQASDGVVPNRRIFFDFTFSPPKSVSLIALLGNDSRVQPAHERAVRSALLELESFAATRVRAGGADTNRTTSNIVAALFTHDTSRALDPHLHTHCIIFNATHDPAERRWKALQNQEMFRAKKFAENVYYHELARELKRFGYTIENQARGDFRIAGISDELCQRFSKRHQAIDAAFEALLRDKPELANGNLQDLRSRLATAERARKQKDLRREDLRPIWEAQISAEERRALVPPLPHSDRSPNEVRSLSVKEAVKWAEEHLFDRHSVVPEFQIWQEALARARGEDFGLGELKQHTTARDYIRDDQHSGDVTLRAVLQRESEIVRSVKDGLGERSPLVPAPRPFDPRLDDEQKAALGRLLRSANLVTIFRGGAGTGKSFVLRELVEQLAHSSRPTVVLAPQRQQVDDMAAAGFPSPQTVSSFLKRHEIAEGAVVIVDEAGQIGGRQMLELLTLVQQRGARLILSGDTRQHGPVEASDAMVAIERFSGVTPVEIHQIRRQDPDRARDEAERRQILGYRSAVEAAASGDAARSFAGLESIKAIAPCRLGEQAEHLAEEYVCLVQQGASSIVVSQTWSEVHRVNARVREVLKFNGLLGAGDTSINVLDRLDLTNAQKRDERYHPPESVIVFNQKVRSAEPGTKGKLAGILKSGVLVDTGNQIIPVSDRFLDRISVCLTREIPVTAGDRLQVKANRRLSNNGARVSNGELVTVKSCQADGGIELTDGRILDSHFREFLPGYAVTSYGSQGKTVDYVLFSDSAIKPATNAEQWYVSISRGRRGIRIFTPDKEQLRENILQSGHRKLALDLATNRGQARVQTMSPVWRHLEGRLRRFGRKVVENLKRIEFLQPRNQRTTTHHEHQKLRMLGH